MKKLILVSFLAVLGGAANAQSRSSFLAVQSLTGVSFIEMASTTYRLSVGPGASFTHNNVVYNIQGVFGVWALNNFGASLNANGTTQNGWTYKESANPDDIAGWRTNPPNELKNGSLDFSYSSISKANINQAGYHVRLKNQTLGGSDTLFITEAAPVPEPASMAALGLGVAALLRRRKKA